MPKKALNQGFRRSRQRLGQLFDLRVRQPFPVKGFLGTPRAQYGFIIDIDKDKDIDIDMEIESFREIYGYLCI